MFTTKSTETILDYREITVTPELAQQWLDLNTANRNKKPARIAAWAVDMQDGEWLMNGEALKFSGTFENPKKLLDGQNRLRAVIASGVPVTLSVFFRVSEASQEAMDSGTRRTVADNMKIQGRSHPAIIAAGAAIAMRVAEGNVNGGPLKASNVAVQRFIKDHPEIEVAADIASRFHRRAGVAPSYICYSYWCMAQIDQEEAVAFWQAAAEKVGLYAGDPVLAMTERFAQYKATGKKLYLNTALSLIFRAWNARREGRSLHIMKTQWNGQDIAIPELV